MMAEVPLLSAAATMEAIPVSANPRGAKGARPEAQQKEPERGAI